MGGPQSGERLLVSELSSDVLVYISVISVISVLLSILSAFLDCISSVSNTAPPRTSTVRLILSLCPAPTTTQPFPLSAIPLALPSCIWSPRR